MFFFREETSYASVWLFITGDNHGGRLELFINIDTPKEEKQGEHDEHCDLKPVWKYVSADNGSQDVWNLARVFLHHIVEIFQHPEIVQPKTQGLDRIEKKALPRHNKSNKGTAK